MYDIIKVTNALAAKAKHNETYRRSHLVSDRAKTEGRQKRSRNCDTKAATVLKSKIKIENTDSFVDPEFDSVVFEPSKRKCLKRKDETSTKLFQCLKVRKNMACILNNSTAIPFSHAKSKFNCFVCHEGLDRCDTLQEHYRTEHAKQKFNFTDNIIKKINNNSSIKLDVANLACKLCQQRISDYKSLIDHLTSFHNVEYDKSAPDIVQPFKLCDDDLRCHVCDEKFVYFIKLVTHLNDNHEDKKYMCDICGKSFKDMSSYNLHGWHVHGPGYNCPDCGRRCSNSSLLREHMASTHGKGKFKCKECPSEFTSVYKRKKHIISVHKAKEVPASFKCSHCDKVFTCTSQRNVHVRKVHLQEKNEVCPICEARLFNKTRLNLHMVKHLRERNHVCDVCGKKYQWKKNLKVHMQKTHSIL